MGIDPSTLTKLETLPASWQGQTFAAGQRVVVLLKLNEGGERPAYVTQRTLISAQILTGELLGEDLVRLEADPAVASFAFSRALPLIG